MTTMSDVITSAGRALGYLGRTEVLSAGDANDGLTCFNNMLDSWSNETLAAYVSVLQSFPLTINQSAYTIGTGGDFNTARPQNILQAFVRDANNIDYQVDIVPQEQWNDITQKTITSQIPNTLFYYSTFPLGIINIFPKPLLAYTLFFTSTLDQVTASLLTATITMPPGYLRAYILNLALDMVTFGFPCLLGDKEFATLINNASIAKANIKRTNTKDVLASYDAAIVSNSYATYNVFSDSFNR